MFSFSMAGNLDDDEFWLPPQFLFDNDGDDSTTVLFSSKMTLKKLEQWEKN